MRTLTVSFLLWLRAEDGVISTSQIIPITSGIQAPTWALWLSRAAPRQTPVAFIDGLVFALSGCRTAGVVRSYGRSVPDGCRPRPAVHLFAAIFRASASDLRSWPERTVQYGARLSW